MRRGDGARSRTGGGLFAQHGWGLGTHLHKENKSKHPGINADERTRTREGNYYCICIIASCGDPSCCVQLSQQ